MDAYMGSSGKPEDWHSSSNFAMNGAQEAQASARKQCDLSLRTHKQCLDENLTQYHTLHKSLQNKVNVSRQLADILQKRIRSVTSSIASSRESLDKLEQAHNAKNAPLALCSWRMDQRVKRPHRELIRDPFELALENENATLTDCQNRLKAGMMKTENCIASLEDSLKDLQYDFQVKSEALSIDDQCLRNTHRQWHKQVETSGAPLPKLKEVSSRAFTTQNTSNEDSRQAECMKRHTIAVDKERAAQELREESNKLIAQCQRNSDVAKANTEKTMQDRIHENQTMRKNLENKIRETNEKIQQVKHTSAETASQINSLNEPTKLCDTRDQWRKNRPYREQILDPVSTQLAEHRMHLMSTGQQLEQRQREELQSLQTLMKHKEQLQLDLKDKTSALHIDLDCLSHTNVFQRSAKAMKPRPGRVLRTEPSFVPSGGFASGRP
eukprot:gnl/MRDRNA2_/MRDRNA2_105811_c0_seq1.p1 gnl/MRDRNA2_/MRDRNA2_105811_c0~~gnl/MRDRNA2_/MRDRNA2_105811_c0_seq1.p1  ORF type:complete len:471 (+),score=109.50 gnl/MRDRNA2_/MRDRNA2_105811_c0_seq1:97-1413(+)